MEKKITISYNKGLATLAVCALGALSMYLSDGQTGIGWAILGMLFIWG
jgi:hypothetical protein